MQPPPFLASVLNFGLLAYTNRARTCQQYLGDAIFHKRRIANLMGL